MRGFVERENERENEMVGGAGGLHTIDNEMRHD
jgi:hypothetical protein